MKHKIVTRDEWNKERLELLKKEKVFTKLRDEMTMKVRDLPWVKVEKEYKFDTTSGKESLSDLFNNKSQLAVYHFMLGPDWEEGCKSCSFWADNFDGTPVHLANRDVSFVVVSRAPLGILEKFKRRMGWNFKWVSSHDTDFNYDFNVSFKKEDIAAEKAHYNYKYTSKVADEMPGASFFFKENERVYHTYSTFARGLDLLNSAYNWLDLTAKGRDENPEATMSWLRHHDKY